MFTTHRFANVTAIKQSFKQLSIEYDCELKTLWAGMNPKQIPNFNVEILQEIKAFDEELQRNNCHIWNGSKLSPVDYYVATSKIDGIFNLGGDLTLFLKLIKSQDRSALTHYAHLCIDNIYSRSSNYNHPQLTTIGLVQGNALGGGFEVALSNDVIIAERHARFGFPEIIFNLFPGMGALSFLSRRIGLHQAKKMVTSAKIYTADELYDIGIVDDVVEKGTGEMAVYEYIRSHKHHWNGMKAIQSACRNIQPILKSELLDITDIWVDAALRITEKDLKMMHRIIYTQQKSAPKREITVQPQEQTIDLVLA